MVWEYWSTRYLQQALDEIDEDLLDDLEEICHHYVEIHSIRPS